MYCGSCLRDNTLAAELQARGHDVVLLPVYTPTRTDEDNVSDPHVFFGGISVYLEQHVPLLRRTPPLLDFLWDTPAVIRLATGRGVSVDPKLLGELTVSMLRGEEGHQAKEFRKLLRYLKQQPRVRRGDAADVAARLAGAAAPARAPAPRRLHAPRRGPVPRRPARALPQAVQGADRAAARAVDRFVATSDYYADFMAGYLGLPRQQDRGGAARDPLRRARARAGRAASGRSRSATSRGSLPRRACTCWRRPTSGCAASSGSERRASRPRATWRPSTAPTSTA